MAVEAENEPKNETSYKVENETSFEKKAEISYKAENETSFETKAEIGYEAENETSLETKDATGYEAKDATGYKTKDKEKVQRGENVTYLLLCRDNTLYCGWTNDLDKRVKAHNEGKGAKYTKSRRPVKLVYWEVFASKQEAMRREAAIKRLSRAEKVILIRQFMRRNSTS